MKKKVFKNGQAPYLCGAELNELQDWIEEDINKNTEQINSNKEETSAEINTQISKIKEMIKDELYYKPGDSETFNYIAGAHVTSSSKQLAFTLILPKRLDNVTPQIISGDLYARKPTGGYLINGNSITQGNSYTFDKVKNILLVRLNYNEVLDITNNTSLDVLITNLKIDFT